MKKIIIFIAIILLFVLLYPVFPQSQPQSGWEEIMGYKYGIVKDGYKIEVPNVRETKLNDGTILPMSEYFYVQLLPKSYIAYFVRDCEHKAVIKVYVEGFENFWSSLYETLYSTNKNKLIIEAKKTRQKLLLRMFKELNDNEIGWEKIK